MKTILLIAVTAASVSPPASTRCETIEPLPRQRPLAFRTGNFDLTLKFGAFALVPTADPGYVLGLGLTWRFQDWFLDLDIEGLYATAEPGPVNFRSDHSLGLTSRIGAGHWFGRHFGLGSGLTASLLGLDGDLDRFRSYLLPDISVILRYRQLRFEAGWLVGVGLARNKDGALFATGLRLRLGYEF